VVERQTKLVGKGSSPKTWSTTHPQRSALRQQLAAARGIIHAACRNRVLAPVKGEIETQIVAVGDYVKVGDPLSAWSACRSCACTCSFPGGGDPHQPGLRFGCRRPRHRAGA
jgi:hypothetical protein